jgi:hypothetical protein
MRTMKGQAAMEYIMTYGWALVALIAVIAAITATGAFNPSYLISEECTLQPDLACNGHVLYAEGDKVTLQFRVNNGLGYDIEVTGVTVTTSDQEPYEDYRIEDGDVIEQGTAKIITVDLDKMAPTVGDTERIRMSITYLSCAPEVNPDCDEDEPVHTVSGRIVARIEEKE